jgi:hypothetical protein
VLDGRRQFRKAAMLGCVVRGLLSKPEVERIDVVEIDGDILRVVGKEFRGDRASGCIVAMVSRSGCRGDGIMAGTIYGARGWG